MDNQMQPVMPGGPAPEQNKFNSLINKRNIYVFFGIAILLEVLWAGWTFFKPASLSKVGVLQAGQAVKPTVVTLSSPKTSLRIGEKTTVKINISSNKKAAGTDLIINYNPKLLSVDDSGTGQNPVTSGTIYHDYPLNSVDPNLGRITVSAISDSTGGVLADGLFGSIVFTAKAPGLVNITLDFSPGKTTNSNVTESGTGNNLLEKVNNLQINILP